MIITDIKEIRLHVPSHAFDSIDGLVGYIDNSEHDFLLQPLGQPLYDKLCDWYNQNRNTISTVEDKDTTYYNRLLLMAQRCVAFDAMRRMAGAQGISMNNAGINQMIADDYPKADRESIADAKSTYREESHAALNRLLYTLEQWCKDNSETADSEKREITDLWKQSRYFYLAGNMLIPSVVVLQEYLDYLDSREKFIRMLPDFRFIQEEVLAPAIGEDFLDWIISQVVNGQLDDNQSTVMSRILRKLRKIDTCYLEGRTNVIKVDKQRKIDAHDEGVRLLGQFCVYCQQHQDDILEALGDKAEAYRNSPLYDEPKQTPDSGASPSGCRCDDFNGPDMAMHVTMPLL
jgi:hypothetical protein